MAGNQGKVPCPVCGAYAGYPGFGAETNAAGKPQRTLKARPARTSDGGEIDNRNRRAHRIREQNRLSVSK